MVYKVCEFKGTPRIKISEEPEKSTIPGAKCIIRAFSKSKPVFDILCLKSEYDQLLGDISKIKIYDKASKK